MRQILDNIEEVRTRIRRNLQGDEAVKPLVVLRERLLPVRGRLAQRYLGALKALLGKTCRLDSLHLDRRGWSPEVAAKLGEGYLSIAGHHPVMVIVSPDQAGAPLYHCSNSFDEELCTSVYRRCRTLIAALTPRAVLWGELDNGVSLVTRIDDLLLVESIVIALDTPDGCVSKIEQLELMSRDIAKPGSLTSKTFLEKMTALARQTRPALGDPRKYFGLGSRKVDLAVGSFTTSSFGGITVLRGEQGILIVHRKRLRKTTRFGPKVCFAGDFEATVDALYTMGFVRFDLSLVSIRMTQVEDELLAALRHEVLMLGGSKRKRALHRARRSLPKVWHELSELRNRLHASKGQDLDPARLLDGASAEMRCKLFAPAAQESYVYRLLAELDPSDYLRAYRFHSEVFMRTFLNGADPLRKLMFQTVMGHLLYSQEPRMWNPKVNAFLARYPEHGKQMGLTIEYTTHA